MSINLLLLAVSITKDDSNNRAALSSNAFGLMSVEVMGALN